MAGNKQKQATEPVSDWRSGRSRPQLEAQFDCMSDKEFLYAFLKLSQKDKESLMVSEIKRRRTFAFFWPIETIVKANDCAKEGFYYTGVADRVQCAFCHKNIMKWKKGDVPKERHKSCFSSCPFLQGKSENVEANGSENGGEGMYFALAAPSVSNQPAPGGRIDVLEDWGKRRETYERYPPDSAAPADSLCDAGFYYVGPEDLVNCFWCKGELSGWERGDDPWLSHAMMFPGCTWLQKEKGLVYIHGVYANMAEDDIALAQEADYQRGDTLFLNLPADEVRLLDQPVK